MMVVTDDSSIASTIKQILTDTIMDVSVYLNCGQAMQHRRLQEYDLAVIHGNVITKDDSLHCVKELCSMIPGILIVNESFQHGNYDWYDIGLIDFIIEPINPKEFINRVEVSFKRKTIRKSREEFESSLKYLKMSYDALYENTPDAIVYFDTQHKIVDVNPRFTLLFGYEATEVKGQYINKIIDPYGKVKEYGSYRILAGETVFYEETIRYNKNGQPIPVMHKGIPVRVDGTVIGGYTIYTDIRKQKEATDALKNQLELTRMIASISSKLINIPLDKIDDQINSVFDKVGNYKNIDRIYMIQMSKDKMIMEVTHQWAREGVSVYGDKLRKILTKELSNCRFYLYEHGYILASSDEEIPSVSKDLRILFEKQAIKGLLIIPLFSKEQLIGFLGFESTHSNTQWNSEQIVMIKMLSEILVNALERRVVETALYEQLAFIEKLMDTIPNPVFYKNANGQYLGCNGAFEREFGISREDLKGKTVYDVSPEDFATTYREMDEQLFMSHGTQTYETRVRMKNSIRDVIFNKATFENSEGEVIGLVGIIIDITERKQLEEKNSYLAYHDPLTGLFNTRSLYEQFDSVMKTDKQEKQQGAVIFLDLDNFKVVNDSFGHQFGDLLLQEVSTRLTSCAKKFPVYRLGGDEFVILVSEIAHLQGIIDALQKSMNEPFIIIDSKVFITTSMGISHYPQDGEDINVLINHADAAMYRAKENGRNQYCFYSEPNKDYCTN